MAVEGGMEGECACADIVKGGGEGMDDSAEGGPLSGLMQQRLAAVRATAHIAKNTRKQYGYLVAKGKIAVCPALPCPPAFRQTGESQTGREMRDHHGMDATAPPKQVMGNTIATKRTSFRDALDGDWSAAPPLSLLCWRGWASHAPSNRQ